MVTTVSKCSVLAVAGALMLSGCGGDDAEESASGDWLQQNGYSVTTNDYLLAAEAGDLQSVELLREGGIAVDATDEATGDTALIRASGTGQMEMIRHLLSEGADVAAVNNMGRPALTLAAQEGHTEVVRLLLSYGADPEVKDKDGWNALTAAAYHGRDGAVEVLAGKMKDELDDSLLVASLQGHPSVVDQLLNRGAYVNTRSDGGQTPLMLAAKGGHLGVVEMLMSNSANPYALDRNDNTAATLAKRSGHGSVSEYLLQPENASPSSAEEAVQELVESSDAQSSIDGATLMFPDSPDGTVPEGYELALVDDLALTGENGETVAATDENNSAETTSLAAADVENRMADDRAEATDSSETPVENSNTGDKESSPLDSMRMESYREKPLPVMLTTVEGDSAEIRVLSKPSSSPATQPSATTSLPASELPISKPDTVRVREGEMIAGTNYRVATVDNKFVSSKEGKGQMVDVSEMTVEDTATGERHLLVKDVPGRSAVTYAVVTMQPGDQRYVVHENDRFTAVNSRDKTEEFQVLEIRPTQVLIENLSTRKVVTIEREGVAMR